MIGLRHVSRTLRTAAAMLLFAGSPGANAIEAQRVTTPSGIEAWLVEDRRTPVIALAFAFDRTTSDFSDVLPGTAQLASMVLDEGAGPYDSLAFQRELQSRAISLRFATDRDGLLGTLVTLARHRDTAFDLMRLALNEPRLAHAATARMQRCPDGRHPRKPDRSRCARPTHFFSHRIS